MENYLIGAEKNLWSDWSSWHRGKKERAHLREQPIKRDGAFPGKQIKPVWQVTSWHKPRANRQERAGEEDKSTTGKLPEHYLDQLTFKYSQRTEQGTLRGHKISLLSKGRTSAAEGWERTWQCLHLKPRASLLLGVALSSPASDRSPLSSACTATVTTLLLHCRVLSAPRRPPTTWATTPPPPRTLTSGSTAPGSTRRHTWPPPARQVTPAPPLCLSTTACRGLTWVQPELGAREESWAGSLCPHKKTWWSWSGPRTPTRLSLPWPSTERPTGDWPWVRFTSMLPTISLSTTRVKRAGRTPSDTTCHSMTASRKYPGTRMIQVIFYNSNFLFYSLRCFKLFSLTEIVYMINSLHFKCCNFHGEMYLLCPVLKS